MVAAFYELFAKILAVQEWHGVRHQELCDGSCLRQRRPRDQPAAGKVSARFDMPVFAPSPATLTLLLLLAASPRNPPLETSAFTSPSMALALKTLRLLPSGPTSSLKTMSPVVPSAGLHQVGYKIFAAAATDAAGRRPSSHPRRP